MRRGRADGGGKGVGGFVGGYGDSTRGTGVGRSGMLCD